MVSSFTWLDFSEGERRQALDVIDQFRDEDTRDELGLSTIRDTLADQLFPGTSTIQTRARYFLFIPWMYLELERRKISSARVAKEGRKGEIVLIERLVEAAASGGVIGERARGKLKRLPSNVYWAGLRTWGILQFGRSQEEYHRWLDPYYKRIGHAPPSEEDSSGDGLTSANWHPHLPGPPPNFPDGATFDLTADEADYLADRIRQRTVGSLLAFFVGGEIRTDSTSFPWTHPAYADLPAELRRLVDHAHYFSELMHGAALLYNLLLAESHSEFEKHQIEYRKRLDGRWTGVSSTDFRRLAGYRDDFWDLVDTAASHGIPGPTRSFVNRWHQLTTDAEQLREITDGSSARQLVRDRERSLKRARARIGNDRLLQGWGGKSGAAQLNYRWPVASQIIDDIVQPLKG